MKSALISKHVLFWEDGRAPPILLGGTRREALPILNYPSKWETPQTPSAFGKWSASNIPIPAYGWALFSRRLRPHANYDDLRPAPFAQLERNA